MITKDNFYKVLEKLGFSKMGGVFYVKKFEEFDSELRVDTKKEELIYPENCGFKVNERQTCNFKANENFVVFECVHRLFVQGYHPKHIELEPKWQVGHGASGGRADILVKDNSDKSLLIIECKTAGSEFSKAWNTTQTKPTQLFSYVQQARSTKFIALYASDFVDEDVKADYYLISMCDNEELHQNNPSLARYADATEVEDIYNVWAKTYEKEYATLGLFEDNKPYKIGKTKFRLSDLKNISSKDIQGKYHEFATILRQHNVSGRENAFDKLVNLFLCKVVDEEKNKDELKFYWKGKAYDNPFDFQDRLQQLYKEGMKEFLGEDITYIDNTQIDSYFEHLDLHAIQSKMKDVLKELKFFTNNDFAFIDVHNEKLFYQNFEVLLKIAKMIQDISLTTSDENQFLGDMFEGFLDQGVKQSEGQFFTPMPIVKFIINSLPNKQNPNVIDYACGAGHFLNEYFTTNKESHIIGVEKEYRLSKVAKVSSFMYGSKIDIIYADALSSNAKITHNSFDVLVANPPYSVKGFLETLSHEERQKYDLLQTIDPKSYTANNAIECFFIERAKQLLTKEGVAGIIVPSSILNKGAKNNVYVKTREILLRYFDIIAIAEFGSGTFGKTGTNTVTLFLKRRCDRENLSGNFEELARNIFTCKEKADAIFKDKGLLEAYCAHINIEVELYKTLLCDESDETLFAHDIFKEYRQTYEKLNPQIKKKTPLTDFIKEIEQEKFYYFCLASKNTSDVIIVKSPSDNKEAKKFLGYEWSSAKGNEGIHYLATHSLQVEEDDLDEEDKRILENLQGLGNINTPLYNPKDANDTAKINTLIKNAFTCKTVNIPKELESYVSKARLVDMLDFMKVEFNKTIGLNPNKKIEIIGKPEWQRKLGDVCDILIGGTPSRANASYFEGENLWLSISEMNGQIINDTKEKISNEAIQKSNVKLIPKGTTLLSFKLSIGKTAIAGKDLYTNEAIAGLVPKGKDLRDDYLFCLFNGKIIDLEKDNFNTFGKSLNSSFLKNEVKIPLPPLDIQEQIVKECANVDDEVAKANETIEKTKEAIEKEISAINGKIEKIGDFFQTSSGGTPLSSKPEYYLNGTIPWVNSGEVKKGLIYDTETKITQLGLENSSAKLFPIDTVLVAMYGATTGEIGILKIVASTNQAVCGIFPNASECLPMFLYYFLKGQTNNLKALSKGVARSNISQEVIKNFKIPLPTLETQKAIVTKIEALESNINEAKNVIEESKAKKEAILKQYL
ncbi:MAG: type I restriction endonuclease subunit M [Epsilonproteobacteria bacterium]|nr:type I restriction endonuclease subunit M [Campylobacterota bacterium]